MDPSINTLPYLRTLLACIEDVQNDKRPASPDAPSFSPGSNLWQKMLIFIEAFDPVQVRYAGHDWRRLLETVARSAEKVSQVCSASHRRRVFLISKQPSSAIQPIETALLRLDATSSCFTSVHLVFVRLCLKAKAHVPALTILNNDILFFPSVSEKSHYIPLPCSHHEMSSSYITKSSGLSDTLFHRDHLLYFLYGAMTYIQLKNWSRAQLFLEFVIMSPIFNSVSMIQVEAYKKWVLVSLISNGRVRKHRFFKRMQETTILIGMNHSYCLYHELQILKPQGSTGFWRDHMLSSQTCFKRAILWRCLMNLTPLVMYFRM